MRPNVASAQVSLNNRRARRSTWRRVVRRPCGERRAARTPTSWACACWYYALVPPSRLYAIGNELDQLLRRDRCLRDVDTERLQRVLDGGDDRRCGRDGADFARALGAERIERRRSFLVDRLDEGNFHGARQQIVRQCGGGGLSALVESHPLQDRVADAMRHATHHLAVDHHGIDQNS